jgi:class 3 adenylate cyclase/tetratricopeptide (TPR) repeat protein
VAERRLTTVLFADLVGFTTISEARDHEEVRELLSGWFTATRTVIERYGGTVEKFIGDAVMAVWGVPTAMEDDAERAVRAGLELIAATQAQADDLGVPGLSMRVGLVTGEVAVTLGATGEGMVAGDAVNTAARVQAAAPPGQVYVDDTTRSLTSAAIAYEDTGEHELKGKARPMRLFAARAVVGSVRGTERVDGLEAPITGRDREIRLLKELFHTTEETGRPAFVVLEGEAGVGKSRVAWEFEKYIDGLTATVRWHRGRCIAYGDGVAFWALAEAVRGRLGLTESETGDAVGERLDEALERYVPESEERAWLRPRLAVLLGVATPGAMPREELFAAWAAFLERVGEGHVVVLVLDDAHHADDGLLDFLDHVLGAARFPLFVLALARTGLMSRRPDLAANRRTTLLHLEPLEPAQMERLLDGLVAGLPEEARAVLVERAEGIPLYAVETVRALIDLDLVLPVGGRYVLAEGAAGQLAKVSAPASLQALVAARLDSLAPSERRVVADASVLGMTFTQGGIQALAADVPDLDEVLRSLARKQIVSVETDRFSSERGQYRFVQSVVRQVAYDTLSHRDRKARHLTVAAHIAAEEDPGDDNAPLLAQHYLDALKASAESDPDRAELVRLASVMLERAAKRAQALGAPREALRLIESALTLGPDPTSTARLRTAACQAANDSAQPDRGIEHGRAAVALYEQLGAPSEAGLAAAETARCYRASGDMQPAIELLGTHWRRLADDPGADPEALLRIGQQLSAAHQDRGELDEARGYLDRVLTLSERTGDPAEMADALNGLARQFTAREAPFTGHLLLVAAADVSRRTGSPRSMSRALMNLALEELARDVDRGVALNRESLEVARKSGVVANSAVAAANLGLALWTRGEWDDLAALLVAGEDLSLDPTLMPIRFALQCWLAHARGSAPPEPDAAHEVGDSLSDLSWAAHGALLVAREQGRADEAAAQGARSVGYALRWQGLGDDFMHLWPPAVEAAIHARQLDLADELLGHVADEPPALLTPALAAHLPRLRGLLGAARGGDPRAVEADLREGAEAMAAYGAVPYAARAQQALGQWLADQGRDDQAEPWLDLARGAYERLAATAWLRELGLSRVREDAR